MKIYQNSEIENTRSENHIEVEISASENISIIKCFVEIKSDRVNENQVLIVYCVFLFECASISSQ